ncbi:MAG: hypothetical protein NUV96_02900 [Candidatus Colwellbacteria bacterium]|nr:hypothetical protein [Candidatus Colwellbacteria bacterium]
MKKEMFQSAILGSLLVGLIIPSGSLMANIQSAFSAQSLESLQSEMTKLTESYKVTNATIKGLGVQWNTTKDEALKKELNSRTKEQVLLLADISELTLEIISLKVSSLKEYVDYRIEYTSSNEEIGTLLGEIQDLRNRIEKTETVKELKALRSELQLFRNTEMKRVIGFAKADMMADKVNGLGIKISGVIRPGMYNNGIQSEELSRLLEQSDTTLDAAAKSYKDTISIFDSLLSSTDAENANIIWTKGSTAYEQFVSYTKTSIATVRAAQSLYNKLLVNTPTTSEPVITYFDVVINREAIINDSEDGPQAIAYWESKNAPGGCMFEERMGFSIGGKGGSLDPSGTLPFTPETTGKAVFMITCYSEDLSKTAQKSVTREIPAKAASIEVNLAGTSATATSGSTGPQGKTDQGNFTIDVDITAVSSDVQISKPFGFGVHGGDASVVSTITSSAGQGEDGSSISVKKGETERFTLSVTVTPKKKGGFFNVSLQSILWDLATAGKPNQMFVIGATEGGYGYRTDFLYLDPYMTPPTSIPTSTSTRTPQPTSTPTSSQGSTSTSNI